MAVPPPYEIRKALKLRIIEINTKSVVSLYDPSYAPFSRNLYVISMTSPPSSCEKIKCPSRKVLILLILTYGKSEMYYIEFPNLTRWLAGQARHLRPFRLQGRWINIFTYNSNEWLILHFNAGTKGHFKYKQSHHQNTSHMALTLVIQSSFTYNKNSNSTLLCTTQFTSILHDQII